MTEFTVFEKTFEQKDDSDGLFIRLTCDNDSELQYVKVKSITLNESLGLTIPTMVIDFVDGSGDFVNNVKLNTDAVYTLHFGREMIEASESKFKIFSIQHGNGTQGRSKNTGFKVVFSHESWEDIIAIKKNRGWSQMKYSAVVSEIVSDKGFNNIDVEESQSTEDTITQINIADQKLLKYIQHRATPASRDGHYVFCGTLDNNFFFKSTYELIQTGMELHKNKKMVILRLGGQPSTRERERMYKENEKVPVGFSGFGSNESYAGSISNGASGVEASYYDWNNRAYIKEKKTLADINSTQLSEWSSIRKSANYISKKVFGGRDGGVVAREINTLSESSMNMQPVTINLEGQLELHCGDIVEVIIPTADDNQVPFNEMYSGFYMIDDIQHMMTLNKATDFVSQIKLTRNGMDAKDMKGYVRSKKGKVSTNE